MKTKLMTKLALAAAVVALGLAAQAEALYWQASGITSSPNTTLTGTGQYRAYIFADTDSTPPTAQMFQNKNNKSSLVSRDTIKAMLASNQDITQYAFKNGTVNSDASSATYSSDKGRLNTGYDASTGTASYEATVGWIGYGGKVDLFAVILDGTSWDTASNYMFLESSIEGTISTSHNVGYSNTFHFGSQEDNWWTAIGSPLVIPEPTSGLLLLVGLSALALRRKKAA